MERLACHYILLRRPTQQHALMISFSPKLTRSELGLLPHTEATLAFPGVAETESSYWLDKRRHKSIDFREFDFRGVRLFRYLNLGYLSSGKINPIDSHRRLTRFLGSGLEILLSRMLGICVEAFILDIAFPLMKDKNKINGNAIQLKLNISSAVLGSSLKSTLTIEVVSSYSGNELQEFFSSLSSSFNRNLNLWIDDSADTKKIHFEFPTEELGDIFKGLSECISSVLPKNIDCMVIFFDRRDKDLPAGGLLSDPRVTSYSACGYDSQKGTSVDFIDDCIIPWQARFSDLDGSNKYESSCVYELFHDGFDDLDCAYQVNPFLTDYPIFRNQVAVYDLTRGKMRRCEGKKDGKWILSTLNKSGSIMIFRHGDNYWITRNIDSDNDRWDEFFETSVDQAEWSSMIPDELRAALEPLGVAF